jgi:hypothetical protein
MAYSHVLSRNLKTPHVLLAPEGGTVSRRVLRRFFRENPNGTRHGVPARARPALEETPVSLARQRARS